MTFGSNDWINLDKTGHEVPDVIKWSIFGEEPVALRSQAFPHRLLIRKRTVINCLGRLGITLAELSG